MNMKITTVSSVEEAEKFNVDRAWNETIKEVMIIEPDPKRPDSNHGFKTETHSTFAREQVPGYCYIMYVPVLSHPHLLRSPP